MHKGFSRKLCAVILVLLAFGCFIGLVCRKYLPFTHYSFPLEGAELHGASLEEEGILAEGEAGEDVIHLSGISLREGNYTLSVEYEAGQDTSVSVYPDNDLSFELELPSNGGIASRQFSLDKPTDRGKLSIHHAGGRLLIKGISLDSERAFFRDGLFLILLQLLLALFCILVIWKWEMLDVEKRKAYALLALSSIMVSIPAFLSVVYYGGDTRGHLLRIEGIASGLLDGQYPVVIAPNYANEFGELVFLYPNLFLYPAGILVSLGSSMLLAYQVTVCIVNAASVMIMYGSALSVTGSRKKALACGIIYAFEPIRVSNMYFYGSGLGDGIAMVFIPLMIAGIYHIIQGDRRKWPLLAFGFSGVLESHVLTMAICTLFLLSISILFLKKLIVEKRLISLVKAGVMILLMNAGFLAVFIRYYFSGWDRGFLQWGDFYSLAMNLKRMFTSAQSLFLILLMGIALFLLWRGSSKKEGNWRIAAAFTACCAVWYLMGTFLFPWKILLSHSKAVRDLVVMFQFPSRGHVLCAPLIILTVSLLAGEEEAFRAWAGRAVLSVLCILLSCSTVYEAYQYFQRGPLLRDEIWGNYNNRIELDYVPQGTSEESIERDVGRVSEEDAVESLSYRKKGTHIDYSYIAEKPGIIADLPLLYYDGYRAVDEAGRVVNLYKGDGGHIFAELLGDGRMHELHVWFQLEKGYRILYGLSLLLSAVFVIKCLVFSKTKDASEMKAGGDHL